MKSFWQRLTPFFVIFLLVETAIRITLLARVVMESDISAVEISQIMLRGFWFDCVTASFALIPIVVILFLVREKFWQKPAGRLVEWSLRFALLFATLFGFVAEHIFWTEFATRFNFIAVDYLVYTQEVIGNIMESYPVGWLILGIAIVAMILATLSLRNKRTLVSAPFRARALGLASFVAVCLGLYTVSDVSQAEFNDNAEASEIAANGVYNLFHAFWHNEIDYNKFYVKHDKRKVEAKARTLLTEENSKFEDKDSLIRIINPGGKEQHKNVILVVMESMSAEYMQAFGNKQNLTPNLDRLAKEGLFFSKTYATGTRTVRGLEAVTLSIPPTPGQSLVRRPGNENLFSLGFVFKDRGYDTKFLYGGYGYFDNMNAFFAGNGFDVVDRTDLAEDEVHFANVWGVADDDLFARAIKEADKTYAENKPFMQLIMTTSNHRPFTFPEGKIDVPSKSGRAGGVKYADYSVGKLEEWAKTKPWYKDTVFIFVADHTAGAGGKIELDPERYHIPMIFYAPGFIKPKDFKAVASQIDLAPILLGQLNFHYRTKFYGEDLLHDENEIPHAFISNYQKVALVKEDEITVLAPKRQISQFDLDDKKQIANVDNKLVDDAIAYYQSASWWKKAYRRVPTVIGQ